MILTAMDSIAVRVSGAVARALGVDVSVVYVVIIAIFALTMTAALLSRNKSKTEDH